MVNKYKKYEQLQREIDLERIRRSRHIYRSMTTDNKPMATADPLKGGRVNVRV